MCMSMSACLLACARLYLLVDLFYSLPCLICYVKCSEIKIKKKILLHRAQSSPNSRTQRSKISFLKEFSRYKVPKSGRWLRLRKFVCIKLLCQFRFNFIPKFCSKFDLFLSNDLMSVRFLF